MATKIKQGMTGKQVADTIDNNFTNLENKQLELANQFEDVKTHLNKQLCTYEENIENILDSKFITTDDEDLTTTFGIAHLKDRSYEPNNFSGKGYKILRKNIVCDINGENPRNILTQDMLNKESTVYEIRYDFDLNENEINIPNNSYLKFNGGTINNTNIKNINQDIYVEWFGAKGNNINDDTNAINQAAILARNNNKKLIFSNKNYYVTDTIDLSDLTVYGNNATINYNGNDNKNIISLDSKDNINNNWGNTIKNININGNNKNVTGIYVGKNTVLVHINRINITKCNIGIDTKNGISIMDSIYIEGDSNINTSSIGIKMKQDSILTNANIVYCAIGVQAVGGQINNTHIWGYKPRNTYIGILHSGGSLMVNNCYFDTIVYRDIEKNVLDKINDNYNGGACIISESDYSHLMVSNCIEYTNPDGIENNKSNYFIYIGNRKVKTYVTNNKVGSNCIELYKTYNDDRNYVPNYGNSQNWSYNFLKTGIYKIADNLVNYQNIIFTITSALPKYPNLYIVNVYNNNEKYSVNSIVVGENNSFIEFYLDNNILYANIKDATQLLLTTINYLGIVYNPEFITDDISYVSSFVKIKNNFVPQNTITTGTSENRPVGRFGDMFIDTTLNAVLIKDDSKWNYIDTYVSASTIRKGEYKYAPSLEQNKYGFSYYSTDLNKPIWWRGDIWRDANGDPADNKRFGSTEEQPTKNVNGFIFYNTDINKLLIWNSNTFKTFDGYTPVISVGTTENRPTYKLHDYDIGFQYFDTTINKPIFWTGYNWIEYNGNDVTFKTNGKFEQKPSNPSIGFAYFCTDKQTTEGSSNGIMIYYKGDNVWVDALGRIVE